MDLDATTGYAAMMILDVVRRCYLLERNYWDALGTFHFRCVTWIVTGHCVGLGLLVFVFVFGLVFGFSLHSSE